MATKILFLFAISLYLFAISRCYPTGAPTEVCEIKTVNHTDRVTGAPIPPQNGIAPYEIIIEPSTVSAGGKAKVTIRGAQGEQFKGFFIQGEDENNMPVGEFKKQADAQTLDCKGQRASAATHVDRNDKASVTLDWTAPKSKGKVVFIVIIVKEYHIFWDNLQSSTVNVV